LKSPKKFASTPNAAVTKPKTATARTIRDGCPTTWLPPPVYGVVVVLPLMGGWFAVSSCCELGLLVDCLPLQLLVMQSNLLEPAAPDDGWKPNTTLYSPCSLELLFNYET
jgi:hypothetical protein